MKKVLRSGISYNLACSIVEANRWGVTKVVAIGTKKFFLSDTRRLGYYDEADGRLVVFGR